MTTILQDMGYAIRQLRKAPGFTLTAVLTLALGIGANAAIFTLAHAVLLKDLPVADPRTLVRVGDVLQCCVGSGTRSDGNNALFSTDAYERFRKNNPELAELAAMEAGYEYRPLAARREGGQEQARSVMAEFVSGNYFRMFGLQPGAGRLFTDADDTQGAPIVALMSYQTWKGTYNRDASVLGSTFWINTKPVLIVGITPEAFFGDRLMSSPPQFYLPMNSESVVRNTSYEHEPATSWLWLIGRLRPGFSRASLQEKMSVQLRQILSTVPNYSEKNDSALLARQHVVLTDGGQGIQHMQQGYGSQLKLLMWIAGLVLLIASANIANLLLVRCVARKTEMAVRTAIGASGGRIGRQLLTENLVLGGVSGTVALAVSYAGAQFLLTRAFPGAQNLPISAAPSAIVLGFAFLLSIFTSILFGIAPLWIATRIQPADVLRSGARSTAGTASNLQRALVISQAGLSLVLLTGATLFTQSLGNLERSDMKLDATNRYVVHFDAETAGYATTQVDALYRSIENQFHNVPGVTKVGISSYAPMEDNNSGTGIQIEGKPESDNHGATIVKATPEYFDSVGTRTKMGRGIGVQDSPSAPSIAVVNEAFVKTYFSPGEYPIGRRFGGSMRSASDFQIVGVVEDTVYQSVRWKNHAMYFLPMTQRPASDKDPIEKDTSLYAGVVVIAANHPIPEMEAIARKTLSAINPNLAVVKFQSFSAQIADQFIQERMLSLLMVLFGVLALLLATIGLYGVTAYSVARRTTEIGIRMALGAARSDVVRMVLKNAVSQTLVGLAIGIPAAYGCFTLVKSRLYELSNINVLALAIAAGTLLTAAFIAGAVPGRRAASIAPAEALRRE
jgi:macrolide transport system ATP-binding/permease protein